MNTTKLKTLAEKGNKNAALVCKLDEQYSRLISTILIGNNIVNIAMASVGTVLFTLKFGDMGATLSTIVVTIVVLIFGEISPKSIANNCPEQLAMLSAPVVQFLIWIFLPLNILFVGWQKLLTKIFHLEPSAKMSQEELLTLVNEVQEDGTIDEDEGGLLRNAIEFSDQEARDILIHRTDLGGSADHSHQGRNCGDVHRDQVLPSADLPGYHRRYSGNHPPGRISMWGVELRKRK